MCALLGAAGGEGAWYPGACALLLANRVGAMGLLPEGPGGAGAGPRPEREVLGVALVNGVEEGSMVDRGDKGIPIGGGVVGRGGVCGSGRIPLPLPLPLDASAEAELLSLRSL